MHQVVKAIVHTLVLLSLCTEANLRECMSKNWRSVVAGERVSNGIQKCDADPRSPGATRLYSNYFPTLTKSVAVALGAPARLLVVTDRVNRVVRIFGFLTEISYDFSGYRTFLFFLQLNACLTMNLEY